MFLMHATLCHEVFLKFVPESVKTHDGTQSASNGFKSPTNGAATVAGHDRHKFLQWADADECRLFQNGGFHRPHDSSGKARRNQRKGTQGVDQIGVGSESLARQRHWPWLLARGGRS